jgi:hypothetical protein
LSTEKHGEYIIHIKKDSNTVLFLQKKMEEPESEKARLRRIAANLEEGIRRNEHMPTATEEVLIRKKAMLDVLQFLTIEEAYQISTMSRRLSDWFERERIWRILSQRWLSPARHTQCWQWAERIRPEGAHVNYLWMVLAEYAASGRGYMVVYYKPEKLAFEFGRTLTYNNEYPDTPFNTYLQQNHPERQTEYGRFRLVYRTLADYPEARVSFEYYERHTFPEWREPDRRIMIRNKLTTY